MAREDQAEIMVENTVRQIHPLIYATFTPKQLEAIRTAVRTSLPKKHALDFRGIIPLFFFRLYFVFLMGRDVRQETHNVEMERRNTSLFMASVLFLAVSMIVLIIFSFGVLYILKSEMGIDLFPDRHLWDVLKGE